MELWRLVAHRHWIAIRLFGLDIRVCARCTGYLVGIITASYTIGWSMLTKFRSLGIRDQSLICLLLMIPFIIDWVGQKWGLRESNNNLRVLTGFLVGFSVFLSQHVGVSQEFKITSIILLVIFILIIGHIESPTHE
ncbi:MAG: DUF2085 domain-containing protein [Promethearchaeota archaeon]|jgi:uncharacterized membrane protein